MPRPAYYHNGVEKPAEEYVRAEAACEQKVGGRQFPSALWACMRDAGWTMKVVYE